MALFSDKNFGHVPPDPATVSDGDTFERCNLSMLQPHTAICAGKMRLVFRQCNLVNCDLPLDAVIEGCSRAQVERCAWLHPEWPLPVEPANCPHVTATHNVTIDGVVAATEYERADRMVT